MAERKKRFNTFQGLPDTSGDDGNNDGGQQGPPFPIVQRPIDMFGREIMPEVQPCTGVQIVSVSNALLLLS